MSPSPTQANFIWLYRNLASSDADGETESESGVSTTLPEFASDKFGVRASFEPATATAGEEVMLTVHVHIPEGFHLYGAKNSISPTQLVVTSDGGLSHDAEAVIPNGRLVVASGKTSWWLENVVTLRQSMIVPEGFESGTVEGHVAYTMCDDKHC